MREYKMSDKTALLSIDAEKQRIQQIVTSLYHNVLRDYTAYANRDDIMEGLYKFYTESDVTLISKAQLKQYEQMEKLIIETIPNPIFNKMPDA